MSLLGAAWLSLACGSEQPEPPLSRAPLEPAAAEAPPGLTPAAPAALPAATPASASTPSTEGPGNPSLQPPTTDPASISPPSSAAEPQPAEGTPANPGSGASLPALEEQVGIADVWSGQPVNFALVTAGDQQFAAYFDADRQMTVARRALGSPDWQFATLPSVLGWDSHNHLALALDAAGNLHLSGNMHDVPLIYFRTTRAFDIQSFVQVPAMLGNSEQSCTYPEFFRGPTGDLIFSYRDGSSGSGNTIYNAYSAQTGAWRRLLDSPLTNGEGLRNTYPVGPVLGPDGFWHLVWVWRDTPDAATTHDLSYARSRDLINWESASGRPLLVPITLADSDVVDAVPAGGGMINNNTKVGFDAQGRPLIAYHKYDAAGNTQLYNARFEQGAWVTHQSSSWGYRWQFGGQGTLVFEVEVEPATLQPDGTLTQSWFHARYGGRGAFRLDPGTLAATAEIAPPLPYPRDFDQPRSPTPGMVVRWQKDSGARPADAALQYLLRWETLESNRDLPRDVIPAPTRLELYAFRQRP